jgi:outer membrane protein OmpA-like peptidoglycan-associated protein
VIVIFIVDFNKVYRGKRVMKRFFYSLMFVSLAFVQGCQKDESSTDAYSDADNIELIEMEAAEAEARAIQDLARLLADEAGSELEMANLSEADFEAALAQLEQEAPELLAWDQPSFDAVTFDKDSAELSEEQSQVLAANIEHAKEAVEAGNKLLIQGYADDMSGEAADQDVTLALCEKRANTVKDALVEAGIAEDMIQVAAAGSNDPLTWTTATDEAEQLAELAANRRVEVYAA